MSDNTKIEWADATVNAVNGCSVTSPGCTNCYAMKLAGTRLRDHPTRAGLTTQTKAGPVWNGEVRLHEPALLQPLKWKRPRRIFWNAHGDTFHDAVPDEWIDRVLAVCALTPQHTHMILTKRSSRMREYLTAKGWALRISDIVNAWPKDQIGTGNEYTADFRLASGAALPNVWLGVSVEDQTRADERIPDLLATPAAIRFISAEPLLGQVDLRWIAEPDAEKDGVIDSLLGCNWIESERGQEFRPARPGHQDRVMLRWVCSPEADILSKRKIDWVIAGGESGPGARPMHPDWARSLRDQCAAAGVAFHFKQWGEWHPSDMHEDCTLKSIMAFRSDYSQEWRPTDALSWSFNEGWQGMCLIGKKRTGRMLDGAEYNGLPESQS